MYSIPYHTIPYHTIPYRYQEYKTRPFLNGPLIIINLLLRLLSHLRNQSEEEEEFSADVSAALSLFEEENTEKYAVKVWYSTNLM